MSRCAVTLRDNTSLRQCSGFSEVNQQVVENGTCTGIHTTSQCVVKNRLTLHLMHFCRTCGITEKLGSSSLLESQQRVGRQTSQRTPCSGVAKAEERLPISFNASCDNHRCSRVHSCIRQMIHCAPNFQASVGAWP